jgi:hypothetical protein
VRIGECVFHVALVLVVCEIRATLAGGLGYINR